MNPPHHPQNPLDHRAANAPCARRVDHRALRRVGFTLVELMVALTVGGIALGAIYSVGAASTAHFREQQRVANTQTSLRVAMAQLKRDFQRAGYLGTPNAGQAGESCATPSTTLHDPGAGNSGGIAAISWFDAAATAPTNLNPAGLAENPGVVVADVVLMGNYTTAGEYGGLQVPNSSSVTISQNWHSFQRDFTDWYGTNAGVYNDAVFKDAFPVGRMVRIHTMGERHWFAQITGVTSPAAVGSPVTVSFTGDAMLAGCNAQNGWISPLNAIRYFTADAVADSGEEARFPDSAGPVAQLRRVEVEPVGKRNPLQVGGVSLDDRSVLDYVVGFQLTFWARGAGPNTLSLTDGSEATVADVNATPERMRSVTIELSVRTPEQDPTMPSTPGGNPMRWFRVFNDRPGAARVRTLRSEIFLPNIAFEGY